MIRLGVTYNQLKQGKLVFGVKYLAFVLDETDVGGNFNAVLNDGASIALVYTDTVKPLTFDTDFPGALMVQTLDF